MSWMGILCLRPGSALPRPVSGPWAPGQGPHRVSFPFKAGPGRVDRPSVIVPSRPTALVAGAPRYPRPGPAPAPAPAPAPSLRRTIWPTRAGTAWTTRGPREAEARGLGAWTGCGGAAAGGGEVFAGPREGASDPRPRAAGASDNSELARRGLAGKTSTRGPPTLRGYWCARPDTFRGACARRRTGPRVRCGSLAGDPVGLVLPRGWGEGSRRRGRDPAQGVRRRPGPRGKRHLETIGDQKPGVGEGWVKGHPPSDTVEEVQEGRVTDGSGCGGVLGQDGVSGLPPLGPLPTQPVKGQRRAVEFPIPFSPKCFLAPRKIIPCIANPSERVGEGPRSRGQGTGRMASRGGGGVGLYRALWSSGGRRGPRPSPCGPHLLPG